MDAAIHHGRGEMMRAGHDVGDNLGVGGIWGGGFEHADDRGASSSHGTAAEAYGFAEDIRIAMKSGGPEPVREHDDPIGLRTVVLRTDETAQDGMKAHHLEIGATGDTGLDLARLAQADHGKANGREIAEFSDGAGSGFDVL